MSKRVLMYSTLAGVDFEGVVVTEPADLGSAALAGDVTGPAGANTVAKMQGRAISATAPTTGQLMYWDGTQWLPVSIAGDVTGQATAVLVGRLQGRPVAATAPTDGQGLVWNAAAAQWVPGAPTPPYQLLPTVDRSGNLIINSGGELVPARQYGL